MIIDNEPTKSYHYAPMTPAQISEYIHEEHTPYAQMNIEEGKKHLAELIQKWAEHYEKTLDYYNPV